MKSLILSTVFIFFAFTIIQAQEGKELFTANCTACHTIGKGQLVGPDLKNSHKKYKEAWLIKWIRSSQTLINKNDPIAVALFKQYNEIPMPDVDMTDNQIKSVIAYMKEMSGDTGPVATTETTGDAGTTQMTEGVSEAQSSTANVAGTVTDPVVTVASESAVQASGDTTIRENTLRIAHLLFDPIFWLFIITGAISIAVILTLSKTIKTLSNSIAKQTVEVQVPKNSMSEKLINQE
jgi:cytochrome c551/c552